MKTSKIVFLLCSLLFLVSCGPTQKEIDKQDREKDSLMEIERNNALNNADKLLQQDSTNTSVDTGKTKK